jgi:signal transduction histidine kinase
MKAADASAGARSATILIVDDTPLNLEVTARHLEQHGHEVLVAQDGEEAVARAAFVRPDLILLDVVMPSIDGLETCRRLKADAATADIPVIFMSAMTESVDKIAGFAAGGVDYITKPIDGPELLARVDTHLALHTLRRQLAQRNALLQQEIAVREQTQAALERSNKELEQLAYVASHDMQEPLRMVASYLQLVAKRYQGQLDAEADEFIGYAVDGAKRMQTLINDLLAYSRLGTKARPFEPTDCNQLMATARRNLQVAIEEGQAQIECDPLPRVMGDPTQLLQLFQNLLGNAIKFRRKGEPARVQVRVQRSGDHWHFAVIDDGIGIAPEYFERIFVLFQRLHGRGDYPGTGIGLALCKKIVERHGGNIGVESSPGRGTTFHFALPAA